VFIYIFYVETKGPTLEEIARIFDGDEAEVAQVDIAEKVTHDDSMGNVGVPGEQKESPSV
jgi:cytochrome c551/c552